MCTTHDALPLRLARKTVRSEIESVASTNVEVAIAAIGNIYQSNKVVKL